MDAMLATPSIAQGTHTNCFGDSYATVTSGVFITGGGTRIHTLTDFEAASSSNWDTPA